MWDDKPYNSLSFFLKNKFESKVIKISIDGGFTCPNRDGSISFGGCIFCSEKGSGDFAGSCNDSISEQIVSGINLTKNKWGNSKYIAYFQAFTNTYASGDILRKKYYEALSCDNICGLAIATRPDCLDNSVLNLLSEINKKSYLWVELGLQTSNEESAIFINRGYKNECFETSVNLLNSLGIDIVVHVILGLPNENKEDMLSTIRYVTKLPIQGIKLQLLHVIKGTPLSTIYETQKFHILTKDEYIDILEQCILNIPPQIVIHRLTGDGAKKSLIAPLWSLNKRDVLNSFHKRLRENNSYQGKNYKPYL